MDALKYNNSRTRKTADNVTRDDGYSCVLLESSKDAAYLIDMSGKILDVNREALNKFGELSPEIKNRTAAFFIGRNIADYYPPGLAGKLDNLKRRIIKSKKPSSVRLNLASRVFDISVYPVYENNVNPVHMIVFAREITEELGAVEKISVTTRNYWDLVDRMYEGYIVVDREGRISYVNQIAVTVTGYGKSELIGSKFISYFTLENRDKIESLYQRIGNYENLRFKADITTKKNDILNLLISVSPIINGQGSYEGFQAIVTDLTTILKVQERLQYHVEFEKKIIEISSSFINLRGSELDSGIMNALDIIGRFNREEGIFLYSIYDNGVGAYKTHQWFADSAGQRTPFSRELSMDFFPYYNELIKKNTVIQVNDVSSLARENRREVEILLNYDIRSFLIVPMMGRDRLLGFLGISSRTPREWGEDEINLIKMALGVISIATERKNIQRELIDVMMERLSDRELELVAHLAGGCTWPRDKRLIGKKMNVLPGTLDKFMIRIKEKIRENELNLIITAMRQRQTPPGHSTLTKTENAEI
jgi:PAS domain S-box-containing protein